MKKTLVTICLLFTAAIAHTQSADITGSVSDGEEALIGASVVLLNEKDSTLINFSLSGDGGLFKIPSVQAGEYLLQITFLGYKQYSEPLIANGTTKDMGTIVLETMASRLDQVEIKAEHVPMAMNRDTFEYNADAFQLKPNEVVEDLLRKLPGVEVESDGSIKAQGEDVEQVLVDGKKFFGDDPKMATRNLPADAVKKVQIYDKKSDASEFSGVDDGERQKTINLNLKEDRKAGAFGNMAVGYGTDERYKSTLSLNRFSGKVQISLIGNFNNVNEQGFSVGDYMGFMRGGGYNARGAGLSVNNGLSNGFVETNSGGININWDPAKKTELSFSYFLNSINNDIESTTIRENYVDEGENFFTNETNVNNSGNDNHRFNFGIEQEIDSTQDFRLRGTLSLNNASADSYSLVENTSLQDLKVNSTEATTSSQADNSQLSLNGTYRKKFGKVEKRILTISGAFNDGLNENLLDLESENLIFDENEMVALEQIILQNQIGEDNASDWRLDVSFVEPIGIDKYLEFRYRRRNYDNNVLSEFFDLDTGSPILNVDLSNAFVRDYYFDNYAASFYHNTDKSQLTIEAALQSSHLKGDISFDDVTIETDVFRFLPRMSWRYELGRGKNLRLNYSTSINEPTLQQLQPNADNSNPLNIYIGNPELVPEYRHNVNFRYFNYDQFNFSSFYAFMRVTYTRNSIINVTSFDENLVQLTTPENVDYSLNLSSSQEYASPIRPLKIRFSIRNRIGYNKSFVFINERQSDLERINGNIRLRLENRNKETIDWTLGGSYGYNVNRFSDERGRDISYSSQNLFGDFTYNYKESFSITAGMDVNFYSEEQFGEAQTVPIMTASISKYFLKGQKGEFRISAFDLLNQNLGISRTENQNFVENSEIISLGRYFLASFIYNFKPVSKE